MKRFLYCLGIAVSTFGTGGSLILMAWFPDQWKQLLATAIGSFVTGTFAAATVADES